MSYQSMKDAFLRMFSRGQREAKEAKEASFDPAVFEREFWAQPTDAAKYVYLNSAASFSQSQHLLNSTTKDFGAWFNAIAYNARLGGFGMSYLRWTPQGIVGPNGLLPPDAKMEWAWGVPAFNGELTRR